MFNNLIQSRNIVPSWFVAVIFLSWILSSRISECDAYTYIPPPTRIHQSHCRIPPRRLPHSPPLGLRCNENNERQIRRRVIYRIQQRQAAVKASIVEPDYLITDCVDVENRPSFVDIATRPTILLRMILLIVGVGIALSNIVGNYNEFYVAMEQVAIPLSFITAVVDYLASLPPYDGALPVEAVSPNVRCGTADDALIHLYAAIYTAAATWLALRTGPFCPPVLLSFDPTLGLLAATIFLFSLLAPILTLVHHLGLVDATSSLRQMVSIARLGQVPCSSSSSEDLPLPELTDTELLRAKSLIAVGVVGCLFAPIAIKFAISNPITWWPTVLRLFPAQGTLESSTALFGVFATQASMVAHSTAKAGVAPFQTVAPAFAVVCFALAIFPCLCLLYWLGNDISFFSQYSL